VRIGVDLGGTKIEAVALDDDGRELARRRVATPVGDYAGTVRAVARLVEDFESRLGLEGSVGVAIPGALSPATGMVKNANSVCLIGQALDRDLAAALGRTVRIANDANCFALSEAVDGAAAGAAVAFGVIVGTGTGGGLVVDGRVIGGVNAIAGEWGHNPLPWPDDGERPGARCYCGQNGCIETFLSGPGLARDHRSATGRKLEPPEIAARAAAGEADAGATLERYEGRMAKALASVINVLDPEVIVLGGGLSNIDRLYEAVPARWGAWVFSDQVSTRLEKARHGDSSGVRGAAWLWPAGGDAG
jgi:fructokinase